MPNDYYSFSHSIYNGVGTEVGTETNTRYNIGNVYTEDTVCEYNSGESLHITRTEDRDTGIFRDFKESTSNGNLIELTDITYDDDEIFSYKFERYSEIFPEILIESKVYSEEFNGYHYVDINADGIAEIYTEFDENHRPLTSWRDDNSDGDLDYIYRYNERGYATAEDHRSWWEKIFGLKY